MITTQSRTAGFRDQITPASKHADGSVAKGALADQLQRAALGELVAAFAPVELWRANVNSQTARWGGPPALPVAEANPQGWRSYSISCTPSDAPGVDLVHAARMQSLTWAVMLAVIGIGLWKPVMGARPLVLLTGLSAAASLVGPVAFAPLFSAAFLGGLFCLAARLTIVEPPATIQGELPSTSSSRYSLSRPVATGLLLMACVLTASALDAAEPVKDASQAPLHTVLVPIDAKQQPMGDKYYVPDTFYEELLRRVAEVSGRPKAWLSGRGTYTGVLSRDPVTSHLELSRLDMAFDFHVLQASVSVRVPLQRSVWGAIIRAARVDGRSITPQWTATGDAFVLDPMPVGPHKLELEVLPPLLAEARRQGFDLPLPPLGRSTLQLSFPEDVTSIEVPSAQGRVDLAPEGGELIAQLGAADSLSVRWPTGNGPDAAVPKPGSRGVDLGQSAARHDCARCAFQIPGALGAGKDTATAYRFTAAAAFFSRVAIASHCGAHDSRRPTTRGAGAG